MKKMFKLLSMMLAVAMLLTSTVALAEGSIPMYYIELSNLDMTIDGESLLDLSPLKLKLGAGVSETGAEMALTADLMAGDATALSATGGMAGGMLVGNIEGMSKPVSINLLSLLSGNSLNDIIESIMAQFSEEEQAALMQIFEAVQELTSEEGLAGFETAYAAYMDAVMGIIADDVKTEQVGNIFYVGNGEEQDAVKESIVLTTEDFALVLDEAVKMYDSNPAFLKLINGFLAFEGEEPIESYAALMTEDVRAEVANEMLGGGDIIIDVYESFEGDLIDIVISIVEDAADEDSAVAGTIDIGIGMTDSVNAVMQIADEDGDGIYGSFEMIASEEAAGETETTIYLEATEDGESETLLHVWVGPDPDYGTLGNMAIMPDSEYDSVGIAWGIDDGQYIFNLYDAYTSVEVGCIAAGDNAVELYLSVDDSGSVLGVSALATALTGEISSDELINLAKADPIDLMKASESDLEALGEDVGMVVQGALMTIMGQVPDLMALMMGE